MTLHNAFGSGSGKIVLSNLQCTGNETSLAECGNNGWGVLGCSRSDDVSIGCGNTTCKCRQQITLHSYYLLFHHLTRTAYMGFFRQLTAKTTATIFTTNTSNDDNVYRYSEVGVSRRRRERALT